MWEISSSVQISSVLYSLLAGMIICSFYDILRIIRCVCYGKTLFAVITDILFWTVSAYFVFCLLLITTNGQIRAYIILFIFAGFIIFRYTVSRLFTLLIKPFRKAFKFIKKITMTFLIFVGKKVKALIFGAKNHLNKIKLKRKTLKRIKKHK